MPQPKEWIVTTSSTRPLAEVARELAQAGFKVEQVLDETGIVTGRGSAAVASKLRKVPGVVDVSPSGPIDIGPPDADVG